MPPKKPLTYTQKQVAAEREFRRRAAVHPISEKLRERVNDQLRSAGFDGRKMFFSRGYAFSGAWSILRDNDILPVAGMFDSWEFSKPQNNQVVIVGEMMDPDGDTIVEYTNTALVFAWYTFPTGKVEALAYLG